MYGRNRQMIVLLLGKLKEECAIPTLIDLLEDEEVRLHAISALGEFKREEFRCYFERFQNSTHPGWRKYAEAKDTDGAKLGVSANCHQFSATKDKPNEKICWPDGAERIYDSDGNLVTDPRDVGTYNFSHPEGFWSSICHGVLDVAPWIIFGNNDEDPGPIINYPVKWVKDLFNGG